MRSKQRSSAGVAPAAAVRRTAAGFGAALIAFSGFAACGSERTPPPDLAQPADPGGFKRYRSPDGDVKLPAPASWAPAPGVPPSVVTFSSGHAAVAVWAYPRLAVPETEAEAELARQLLIRSLKTRAPQFKLTGTRVTQVGDALAVELRGRGLIARQPVRVRSLHLYKGDGEYVVDAYADPSRFGRADRQVFRRVISGIRVDGDPPRIERKAPQPGAPAVPPSVGGS